MRTKRSIRRRRSAYITLAESFLFLPVGGVSRWGLEGPEGKRSFGRIGRMTNYERIRII